MTGTTAVASVRRWQEQVGEGECGNDPDLIVVEMPVALSFNRVSHVVMMATPADLQDFALGFSLTEGLITSAEELVSAQVVPRKDGLELAMTVTEACAERVAGQRRNLTGRTGCGLCGAESLEQAIRPLPKVPEQVALTNAALQAALGALSSHQPLQAMTGAVHCAAWCGQDGTIIAAREDVGRHNALDKLIGHLAKLRLLGTAGFVIVSSRASYEMVSKCAAVGIEFMAAVSAPTSLAIELARDCGMSLVGFARAGRHNIYCGAERMKEGNDHVGC